MRADGGGGQPAPVPVPVGTIAYYGVPETGGAFWCSARHVRHAQSRTDEREHAALADANAAEQPGWHQACGAVGAVINVPRQPGGSSGGEPSGKRSQVPRGGLMDAYKVGPTPLLFRG